MKFNRAESDTRRVSFPSKDIKSYETLIKKLDSGNIVQIYFFLHHAFVPFSNLLVKIQRKLPLRLEKITILKFLGDKMDSIDAAKIFNTVSLISNLNELCFSERIAKKDSWPKGFFTLFNDSLRKRRKKIKKVTMYTIYKDTLSLYCTPHVYYQCGKILEQVSIFQVQVSGSAYALHLKHLFNGYEKRLRNHKSVKASFGGSSLIRCDLHDYFLLIKKRYGFEPKSYFPL